MPDDQPDEPDPQDADAPSDDGGDPTPAAAVIDVNAPVLGASDRPGDPGYVVPRAHGDNAEFNWPMAKGSRWDVPPAFNPPGYPEQSPGDTRDQNWRDYLSGKNGDGSQRPSGQVPDAYPHTEAVGDRHLKIVGAAATQQGIRYVWGGGGPNNATQSGAHDGDFADQRQDYLHCGFDCSGLAEYAIYQATGYDPAHFSGTQLASEIQGNPPFGDVIATTDRGHINVPYLFPGDIIYYGHAGGSNNGSQHVAIFAGNGVTVETNTSGTPAHFQPVSINNGQPTTVVRPR